jgi:hypothetical protein
LSLRATKSLFKSAIDSRAIVVPENGRCQKQMVLKGISNLSSQRVKSFPPKFLNISFGAKLNFDFGGYLTI